MFHDDSEIVVWDYVSPQKDWWSKEEKEAYQHACENATNTLVDNYASELWSDYGEILQEMESHQNEDSYDETSFIHALVEYTDKLDALMEIAHELHSGSSGFLNNLKEEFGIDKVCLKYVIDRVDKRRNKLSQFPNYKILSEWVFNIEQIHELDIHKIVENWSKHTPESVKKKSWIEIYDLWKELHFQNWTLEHIEYLYTEHVT